ncbi:hypothetical protein Catovirus_2_105 [Catovirus CTV1]|uniref:Uncharacterized protein n=1 Tax=Catovirus CTV1 TaxID=1977631 RepID=A0A1V0SBS5_9VIRU|nr:hypothetical protein Catovirus_2_105 [Catovirus CTV1]
MDLSDINWYRFSNYNNFWEMEKSAKKILIESKKYDIKDVYNYIKSNDISCDYKFLDNMAYLIEKKYDNKKKQIEEVLNLYKFVGKEHHDRYFLSDNIDDIINKFDIQCAKELCQEDNYEYLCTEILRLAGKTRTIMILSLFENDKVLMSNMVFDFLIRRSYMDTNKAKQNRKNRLSKKYNTEFYSDHDSEDEQIVCFGEPVNLEKTYNIIFKIMKLDVTCDLCNRILERGDEKMFEYITRNNIGKFTQESLKYAYNGASYYIIESLINMKFIPTINDVRNMTRIFKEEILELSYAAGVRIDYDTIISFDDKKITDLSKYGLNYGEELYFALYKEYGVCATKYCKAPKKICDIAENMTSKMNKRMLKFRYDFSKRSLEELKSLIKETNLIPDQYCYDYSFDNCEDVRLWLEKEYKFKPTVLTLIKMQENDKIRHLAKEYLYDKELYRSNINEIYMSKIYDHNYAILNNMPKRKKKIDEKIVKGKKK